MTLHTTANRNLNQPISEHTTFSASNVVLLAVVDRSRFMSETKLLILLKLFCCSRKENGFLVSLSSTSLRADLDN